MTLPVESTPCTVPPEDPITMSTWITVATAGIVVGAIMAFLVLFVLASLAGLIMGSGR